MNGLTLKLITMGSGSSKLAWATSKSGEPLVRLATDRIECGVFSKAIRLLASCLAALVFVLGVSTAKAQVVFTQATAGGWTATVPAGVTTIQVVVSGGGGGGGGGDRGGGAVGGTGGRGARVTAILSVSPGDTISGTVGARGNPGPGSVTCASAAGAGGAGVGSGGTGGRASCTGQSGNGGGGGGGTTFGINGVVVLQAGGGGGGGAASHSRGGGVGGTSAALVNAICTSANGGTGVQPGGVDGGGGGGGGGGHAGGGGGAGGVDDSSGAGGGGGGQSCRRSTFGGFLVGPTVSTTTGSGGGGGGSAGVDGAGGFPGGNGTFGTAGSVTITAVAPTLTKAFAPATIAVGGTSTLTFTLTNFAGNPPESGLSFTDTLPAGLVLAAVPTVSQCGGTVAGAAGTSTITFSGGSMTAGTATCTITVQVTSSATPAMSSNATCPAANTNGSGNVTVTPFNVVNGVTDQCLRVRPTVRLAKSLTPVGVGTFNLSITGGSPTGTTTANGIGNGGQTGIVTVDAGGTITLTETVATGQALAFYNTLLSCVDGNGAPKAITTVSQGVRTIVAPSGTLADPNAGMITCTYANAKIASVAIRKTSLGGVGTFAFNGAPVVNLSATPANIITATAGVAVTGAAITVPTPGSDVQFTEAPPAGAAFFLTSVSCVDANGLLDANPAGSNSFGSFSGNTVTIPGANVVAGAAITCSLTNAKATVRINKTSIGGTGTFGFAGASPVNLATTPANITTVTAGTGVPNAFVNVSALNAQVQFTEGVAPAGFTLTGASCTDANGASDGNPDGTNPFGSFAGGTVTIPAANVVGGAAITCSLTNTRAVVRVSKTSLGATGTFTFARTNLGALANITTVTSGTPVANAFANVTTLNSDVTITETPAANFILTGASCSDANATTTGNPASFGTLVGNVLTIPGANVVAGAAITCSFTNARLSIRVSKTSLGSVGNFTFAGGNHGALAAITTTTAGVAVSNAPVTITNAAANTTIIETPAAGFTLTAASCTDANGATDGNPAGTGAFGSFAGSTVTIPAANQRPGGLITCELTNTGPPTIRFQKTLGGIGRLAASDQFVLRAVGTGAPAAVTTTGAGTTVSSAAVSFTATAGQSYTLNETIAAGSASPLSSYTQAMVCTNSGGSTNVSGVTLGGSFTVVAGDAIACTVTNTPKAATLRLAKVWGSSSHTGDVASIGATSGGATNTALFTATAPNSASSAVVSAPIGTVFTLPAETMTTGTLSNYATTIACDGGTLSGSNGQVGTNTLTITAADLGQAITCTYTNAAAGQADLAITKTDNASLVSPGGTNIYSVVVSNSGPAPATNAIFTDPSVAGLAVSSVTCGNATGSAVCPAPASTTVPLMQGSGIVIPSLPAGGSVTFTVTGTVTGADGSTIDNGASIAPPAGLTDPVLTNNSATDTDTVFTFTPPLVGACNADPLRLGSDFTSASWTKTNWNTVTAGSVFRFTDTAATATLSQAVTGRVTPGALVTFNWSFSNGGGGTLGSPVTVRTSYGGTIVWQGTTAPVGTTIAPASAAQNGATCVSGCGAVNAGAVQQVVIRLPLAAAATGTLAFTATVPGGVSDDVTFSGPISIANTGICLAKNSIGGSGSFAFTSTGLDTSFGGGGTSAAVTTTASNAPVYFDADAARASNQPLLVLNPGSGVTIAETPATGFALQGVSCTAINQQTGASTTVTPVVTGNSMSIANVPQDTLAICTFINQTSTLSLLKALSTPRVGAGDQFSVAIRTGGVAGTVENSTTNSTTTGSGAVVTPGSGSTGILQAVPGTIYTLTEAASGGANLADYNATIGCTDSAGLQAGLPVIGTPYNPLVGVDITPVAGATISCTITNASAVVQPTITIQKALAGAGRIAPTDQFVVELRTGGASGTIVNSTTNSTTLGSGSTVIVGSGTTGTFVASAGTAYTITEVMATGSTTGLAQYGAVVACTNTGPTNVAGITPGAAFTPVAGDAIVCTLTNTPINATLSGRVFLDNGVGSGTANDGIANGGEMGLDGIVVNLTDCAGTILVSTLTDASGTYSLNAAAVASGTAICIEESNAGTQISTGASALGTVLPSGAATIVGGTSYTYTRTSTPDRIVLTWDGVSHSALDFGDVDLSTFGASGAQNSPPGGSRSYPHSFTAGTAGTVVFSVPSATATPTLGGWSEKIFADPACSGSLQPGATQLYPPLGSGQAVVFGETVCIIVQELVPATAQTGNKNDASVVADFTYANAAPGLSATYVLHDVTTAANAALDLQKTVRNVTTGGTFGVNNQAKSGDVLEYQVTFTNNASAPISDLTINDVTPAFTIYVASGVGTLPSALTACAKNTPANPAPAAMVNCGVLQTPGGTGSISWRFTGTLNPGASGTVTFQVKIQ